MSQKQQNANSIKKAIWIALPVIIIAVVVIAVFMGQSSSLNDQINKLKADKEAMSQTMDMAVNTERELAGNQLATLTDELEAAKAATQAAQDEAETARKEAQTAKDEAEAAKAATQAAQAEAEAAKAQAQTAQEEAEAAKSEALAAKDEAKTAQAAAQAANAALADKETELQQVQIEKDEMAQGIKQVQEVLNLLVPNE